MGGFEYLFEWKILFMYLFVFPFLNAATIINGTNTDYLKAVHQQLSLAFGIIKYCFLKLELRCHHHNLIDARNVAK